MSVTSADAYGKALLHCFKHPTQAVGGLLVGKAVSSVGTESNARPLVYVADAVPLCHSLPLGAPNPVLDVATMQVAAMRKTQGLSVVGFYVANERADHNTVADWTRRVVRSMAEKHGVGNGTNSGGLPFVLWQVDNEKITPKCDAVAVNCFLIEDPARLGASEPTVTTPVAFAKWNTETCNTKAVPTESVLRALRRLVDAFAYSKLCDFEDHMETPLLDYNNPRLHVDEGKEVA